MSALFAFVGDWCGVGVGVGVGTDLRGRGVDGRGSSNEPEIS